MSEEKKDEYINITEDGGVKKKIIKEGTGEQAKEGSEVHVNYIGRNKDNKIFDQTKDKPFTFKIGVNLKLVILLMLEIPSLEL